jgi:pyruvate dehydrogenase E1 component
MEGEGGPVIAVSDYMKLVPDQVARWVPDGLYPLGTDGFGRSDTRAALRRFFEVDAESVALAALHRLSKCGAVEREAVAKARDELGIDADKPAPAVS